MVSESFASYGESKLTKSVDNGDEIDVEILGSDPKRFSTNIFSTQPGEEPLYGQFGDIKDLKIPDSKEEKDIGEFHKYTIDWSAERIVWWVDGREKKNEKRRLVKGVFVSFVFH